MSEFLHMSKTSSISGFLSWHWAMMLLFQKDSEISYLSLFLLGKWWNNCNCLGFWSMINELFAVQFMLSLAQCSLIPQVCIWKLIGFYSMIWYILFGKNHWLEGESICHGARPLSNFSSYMLKWKEFVCFCFPHLNIGVQLIFHPAQVLYSVF